MSMRAISEPVWIPDARDDDADYYVVFRAAWELDREVEVELRLLGASWYVVWLDGKEFAEGPARFPRAFPQYQTFRKRLAAGRHVLAIQVHCIGVGTRVLESQPPFLCCKALAGDVEMPLRWKCQRLQGYAARFKRISPQFGWIEWCDTRAVPLWQGLDFDDAQWLEAVGVERSLGVPEPYPAANPLAITHPLNAIAGGQLTELFGYEADNPAARFFLRGLDESDLPRQGVWRRYDMGRVRLMRPRFIIDVPAGAVVEFAASESLRHGRVSPWITLSAGDSCNLDHYVARGGPQEFCPLTPKGGRFLEVHVIAPPESVRFLQEQVVERCYYGEPDGVFSCGDELLDRIWRTGVETHRACAEDALVDNPTRERGQWAGDVVTVGMDIAAAAFADLRLCRRGLVQAAQCARDDGLVAGMYPGQGIYLSTFAAQWVSACVHYWELTGERALLEELLPAAERNIAAFENHRTEWGIDSSLAWQFVDWGYVPNPGPCDMAVNLQYLAALREMKRWCAALGESACAARFEELADVMNSIIARYFADEMRQGGDAWTRIGYHRTALGLRLGFFSGSHETEAVCFLKDHMLRCFPNDPSAPRLSDPAASDPRIITPYFAHFAMPALIERGEMEFVLQQCRKCWGWALEDGRTTWLEVFDTRWSHCHQWSGCPTWQLTRYVLGLQPRQDLGERCFVLTLAPGELAHAEGRVPLPGTGRMIEVAWSRVPDGINYTLRTPVPISLYLTTPSEGSTPQVVGVERDMTQVLPYASSGGPTKSECGT